MDGGRNGETMSRSKADQAKREAKRIEAAEPKGGDAERAEAGKKAAEGAAKKPVKLGAKKALRRALKDELNGDGAKRIAEALVEQTVKGDVRSANILMNLVVKKKDEGGKGKKKKRSGPTLGELLASEPDWDEEPTEATVDVGIGRREPENAEL
jgi:hypothetical protein